MTNYVGQLSLVEQNETAIDVAVNGIKNVIPLPYKHMRDVMVGFDRGELHVIGGRPGHCKTTWALALIYAMMKEDPKLRVLVISKEMLAFQLIHKLVAMNTKLTNKNLRMGLSPEQTMEMTMYLDLLERDFGDRFWIYDDKKSVEQLPELILKHKPDLVMDDFIQKSKFKGEAKPEIKRYLDIYKELAQVHRFAFIVLSQLNRAIESRENGVPVTSDLSSADELGWDAANALIVHYPHKIDPNRHPADRVKIISTKGRFGPTKCYDFMFDGDHNNFKELVIRGA